MMSKMEEDKRTSNFSCQSCRVKKVKCSKTFPCDNCVKFKLDCIPQTRKRGRPERTSDKDQHEEPLKRFNNAIERTFSDVHGFVSSVPNLKGTTRIEDFLKSHSMRRQTRHEFLTRKAAFLQGVQFPPSMFIDCFGVVPSDDHALTSGYKERSHKILFSMTGIMKKMGIEDIEAFTGPFRPRSEFLSELRNTAAWVPESIKQLLVPEAFPGAAMIVDYQVNAHSTYSVNPAFSKKFSTAHDIMIPGGAPNYAWGPRKLFALDDLAHYLGNGFKECLAMKHHPEDPMIYHGLTNMIDKHGSHVMTYLRRYYWLQLGGERSATVYVIYPIPDSMHMKKTQASSRTRSKKPAPPAKLISQVQHRASTPMAMNPVADECQSCSVIDHSDPTPSPWINQDANHVDTVSTSEEGGEDIEKLLLNLLDGVDPAALNELIGDITQ
eukprot:TRINITY_DN19665_c0_g2_i1.p1 TRINITY_DN19665_c0_g2~~TRINITY_DN19665_c0_g2_i1.p1  ORF type:complete len:437 (-),score=61.86 TRINITY_DN19665_c0_g2_i1:301-1611(-)